MFQREEDITIEQIDFEWVEKCTNTKHLKRAQQVLKQDGGYYPQLEKAILDKIEELNPDAKKKFPNQNVDPQTKKLVEEALYEWENEIKEREKGKARAARDGNIFGSSGTEYFSDLDEETRKKLSENEKNKGNEAIKSGDLKEALQYYTKSIQYYNKISASYCNRALVYLKMKDYKSCVADCDKALNLEPKYTKALHRRAKANFEMGNYDLAVRDFQEVMTLEPNNSEVNAELMEARKKLGSKQIKSNKSDFKKIAIQEESESDEEEEEDTKKSAASKSSKGIEGTNKFDQLVDVMLLEEQGKSAESKFQKVEELKAKASEFLKTGKYELSIAEYQKGMNILNEIKLSGAVAEKEAGLNDKKAVLLNNIGYCYMQQDLPENVISYCSRVLDMDNIVSDTLVKAYLRRALAYEKIDKIVLALKDYESVKHLNPGNQTASEGLSRIHKMMHKDEDLKKAVEKSRKQDNNKKQAEIDSKATIQPTQSLETKSSIQADLKRYEEEKVQGNNYFKEKNYTAARNTFYEIQKKIEDHLTQNISATDKSNLEKLYISVSSNAAMCCFHLEDITGSLENCEKVLRIDSNHQKSLYRKALCKQKIGDQVDEEKDLEEVERKKKQLVYYEEARKILEEVLHADNKNKDVKEKLSDLVKIIVQIRMKHKLIEAKVQPKENKPPAQEEKKQTETSGETPKRAANKNATPGLNKQYFDNITNNVAKTITDELIASKDLPQTSSRFETDCKGFKNHNEKLYFFVKKIPTDHLVSLYKEKIMPTDLVLNIVSSMKVSGLSDDAGYCLKLLEAFTKTHKFNLFVKQLTNKEKQEIKSILNEVQKNGAGSADEIKGLTEKYNC